MSNFRYRLGEATRILATHTGDIKERLSWAATQQLIFANINDDPKIPDYFRQQLQEIMKELSKKQWDDETKNDRIRATIHRSQRKTLSKLATRIWELYVSFEEYLQSGFIPEQSS